MAEETSCQWQELNASLGVQALPCLRPPMRLVLFESDKGQGEPDRRYTVCMVHWRYLDNKLARFKAGYTRA